MKVDNVTRLTYDGEPNKHLGLPALTDLEADILSNVEEFVNASKGGIFSNSLFFVNVRSALQGIEISGGAEIENFTTVGIWMPVAPPASYMNWMSALFDRVFTNRGWIRGMARDCLSDLWD